jgi:hypothetical protein
MTPRTEDEILSRAPIKTKFGTEEYEIPLLAVTPQREWRKKLFAELQPILAALDPTATGQNLVAGLIASLTQFPDKLADLVFAYAPDLPKDKILAEATEEQLILAFDRIKVIAFPFTPQLAEMRNLFKAVGSQLSGNSTN